METTMGTCFARPCAPYDPDESPGPIASVVERFRPRRPDHDGGYALGLETEASRYTVVLVTPEHAGALGFDRYEAGLKLYLDADWDCDLARLDDAADEIETESGLPVTLVEHHADLTYWTAHLRIATLGPL